MYNSKYEYLSLRVTDILLNSENPRFNPVEHQTEAIVAMIEDQRDKLIALAKHILENGLNPTDIPLVCKHNNQWLVLEGNRRITILKLLNEPSLIPENYKKLRKTFNQLKDDANISLFENIRCVSIQDMELANEWIRLKHTGENAGAGIVGWDSQQTSRFRTMATNNADPRILFLDNLKEHDEIPLEYKQQFHNIRKTNFDRLMQDPSVRNLLGINVIHGQYQLLNGINPYFLTVLGDLITNKLKVGMIYHKKDREKYTEELIEKVKLHGEAQNQSRKRKDDNSTSDKANNSQQEKESKQSKSYPTNRKKLVPNQHAISIQQARLALIFSELKRLDVGKHTNACAALFRVFVELSADCYIEKKKLSGVNADTIFSNKLTAIINDFENKKIMNKHQLLIARRMSSSNTQNTSIKTFHAYVHNKDFTPVAADLKSAWDDLWPFIENIWKELI